MYTLLLFAVSPLFSIEVAYMKPCTHCANADVYWFTFDLCLFSVHRVLFYIIQLINFSNFTCPFLSFSLSTLCLTMWSFFSKAWDFIQETLNWLRKRLRVLLYIWCIQQRFRIDLFYCLTFIIIINYFIITLIVLINLSLN